MEKRSSDKLQFVPHSEPSTEEGKTLDCPVIHPIKFGNVTAVAYRQELLQNHCTACATDEGVVEL